MLVMHKTSCVRYNAHKLSPKYTCPTSNLVWVDAQKAQTASYQHSSNKQLVYSSSFLWTNAGAIVRHLEELPGEGRG